MAFKEMSRAEIDQIFVDERVVRVGFEANGERYLVPLGFVWYRDAMYAMTTRGRKTQMAGANPRVSFQIDTSARTGPFSWQSVSGEGVFEIVTDSGDIGMVGPLLEARFPDMPESMQVEYQDKGKRGEVVFVRIRPSEMAGRRSAPA